MTRCANTEALDIYLSERDADQAEEEAAERLAMEWLAEAEEGNVSIIADALNISGANARADLADKLALVFTVEDDAELAKRFRQIVVDAIWAEAERVVTE
jgi:hypothetical protein